MILPPPPAPELRAAPLHRLLPEVGRAIGTPLEATPPMRNIVLIVRPMPRADPKPLLASIARVTLRQWVKGSDGVLQIGRAHV